MAEEKPEKKGRPVEEEHEILVRILGYDIPGSKSIYPGLTRIKGVSWTISNAACLKLRYPRETKISELTKADLQKIETFLKNLEIPEFLKNRRLDKDTGQSATPGDDNTYFEFFRAENAPEERDFVLTEANPDENKSPLSTETIF